MDVDTIFPALSAGEQIIDKYRHSECCNSWETIVILTNVRLLIRWKETIFCRFHQSMYSAIELNSIFRIHENRLSLKYVIIMLAVAIVSFLSMIIGFASGSTIFGVSMLLVLFGVILYAVYYYFNLRYRYISLTGSFGHQTLKFTAEVARQLEARLSEMMHQTGTIRLNQGTAFSGSPSSNDHPVKQPTAYSGGYQRYAWSSATDDIVAS